MNEQNDVVVKRKMRNCIYILILLFLASCAQSTFTIKKRSNNYVREELDTAALRKYIKNIFKSKLDSGPGNRYTNLSIYRDQVAIDFYGTNDLSNINFYIKKNKVEKYFRVSQRNNKFTEATILINKIGRWRSSEGFVFYPNGKLYRKSKNKALYKFKRDLNIRDQYVLMALQKDCSFDSTGNSGYCRNYDKLFKFSIYKLAAYYKKSIKEPIDFVNILWYDKNSRPGEYQNARLEYAYALNHPYYKVKSLVNVYKAGGLFKAFRKDRIIDGLSGKLLKTFEYDITPKH
jgi:hypothetical protein